jgi:hypothetical protein
VATVSFFELNRKTRQDLAMVLVEQIETEKIARIPEYTHETDRAIYLAKLQLESHHQMAWLTQPKPWKDLINPHIGFAKLQQTHPESDAESA